MPIFGIDVSNKNGNLNYKAIKNSGVRFAMVKATDGDAPCGERLGTDSRFERNIEGFHSVGIPVGAYHIFTAATLDETYLETKHFISTVEPHRNKIILPLVCVLKSDTLSQNESIRLADVFLSRINASGFSACICTDGAETFCGDKLAIRTHTQNGQLVGVIGEFACGFAFEPITRIIIKSRTDITDDVVDYIKSHEHGENILARLADMLVARSIKPLKNPSYERMVPLMRLCCGLTADECAHLCAYRWGEELIHELYTAMVR